MTSHDIFNVLAGLLGSVLGWVGMSRLRRWFREFSKVRIEITYRDQEYKGRPTAKVTRGLARREETFICYMVNVSGATWISIDTGKSVSMFDPFYNQLNDAARKEQLKHESNHD